MEPPPHRELGLLTSTVALKIVVALTGLGLVGFILFHMVGNLQVFLGRETYNDYAEFMQSLGGALWLARAGLLGCFFTHVGATVLLVKRNKAARPERYATTKTKRTTPGARLMFEAGLVLLAFTVYHLLHFTLGVVHAEGYAWVDELGRRDLYSHLVVSFQNPLITTSYLVAQVALAMHLSHGVQSVFKTLGLATGRWRLPFEMTGPAVGLVVLVGNASMPLAVLTGVLTF